MKTLLLLTLSLLVCPFVQAGESSTSVQLRLGMAHADALRQLKDVGAKPFPCSYKFGSGSSPDQPRPYFEYGWFTLPNGMSVEIHSDKNGENDERLVTSLQVCNSTMLFSCKGEIWYSVKSINLADEVTTVDSPSVWMESEEKSREVTALLAKGMPFSKSRKILEAAGLKPLPVDDTWLGQMPKGGKWERYSMKSRDEDCELILHFEEENPGPDTKLKLMLVEATKPKEKDNEAVRYKIECEFLDLKEPLRKEWHWAFGESWAWKPGEKEDSVLQKAAKGQRR